MMMMMMMIINKLESKPPQAWWDLDNWWGRGHEGRGIIRATNINEHLMQNVFDVVIFQLKYTPQPFYNSVHYNIVLI